MYQVQNITDASSQQQTVVLPDGTLMTFSMNYSQQQYGWFISALTYGTFTVNSIRITVNPNMLYQFKNILPFGLGCFQTTANREPTQLEDFATELFQLFILTSDEVDSLQDFYQGS